MSMRHRAPGMLHSSDDEAPTVLHVTSRLATVLSVGLVARKPVRTVDGIDKPEQMKAMTDAAQRGTLAPCAISAPKRKYPFVPRTEAKRLYDQLEQAASIDRRLLGPGWYLALSESQFDMLLAVRLYTGPVYRYMVMTPNEEHTEERFEQDSDGEYDVVDDEERWYVMPDLPERTTDFDAAVFFAMVSAHRRKPLVKCELLLALRDEYGSFFEMDESAFREAVHRFLVDADRPATAFWELSLILKGHLDIQSREYRMYDRDNAQWLREGDDRFDTVFQAYEDQKQLNRTFFWAAMEGAAENLETFIRDSGNAVGRVATPVYRGLKEFANEDRLEKSFSSVSVYERVARSYTSNPSLTSFEDDEAMNACCMLRIVLQPGTPYLDTMIFSNSGGWGFGLSDYELILPPGLGWRRLEGNDTMVSLFPPEIDESVMYKDGFELKRYEGEYADPRDDPEVSVDTRNFNVKYYEVSN